MSMIDDMAGQGLRERQKLETRERVVEAARALFQEVGYEAATIRDIAARAGVAPGSVFTTFANKAELLQEIVFRRLNELFEAVHTAVAIEGPVLSRLEALARAAYATELKELRLLADNIGASWTWSDTAERQNRERLAPLFRIMLEILSRGVAQGELRADLDAPLVSDVIFACYLRAFRRALYDGADADAVAAHLVRQMAMILDGCRPR